MAVLAMLGLAFAGPLAAASEDCVPVAAWVAPGARARVLDTAALLESMAQRRVVLLGEAHDSAEHHRWQLQTLAALHAHRPRMVVGFESFPRRLQPVLDRWVAGAMSERDFLAAVDWHNVWAFDPQLYLPLFHFARMHRIPMVALNVDRETTRAVRRHGFDALEPAQREGVTRPAPPSQAHLDLLYPVFAQHQRGGDEPARDSAAFRRFVESQTLWDRAMAQAIAEALAARPEPLVVGIMGWQHVAHGHGVPHQLADLGVREAAVLLPWDRDAPCGELSAGLAEAVFGVAALPAETPPRLGVGIEPAEGGVRITSVEEASIAAAAGLRAGDLVVEIAGRPARQAGDLVGAIARQAPGTWLPLRVRRDGVLLELLAKFPPLAN